LFITDKITILIETGINYFTEGTTFKEERTKKTEEREKS
jgi:hypothetical protein